MADPSKYVELYKTLSSVPSVDAGYFLSSNKDQHSFLLKFSQTDLRHGKKRSFVVPTTISPPTQSVIQSPFPFDLVNTGYFSTSPSGKFFALIRTPDETKRDESFIEIWSRGRLLHNIPTKGSGTILADDTFAALEWHPSENFLVVIIDPLREVPNFFEFEPKNPAQRGHKFDHQESWGETFPTVISPKPFIVDIQKEKISAVVGIPESLSVGQPVFSKDGNFLVFVGWGPNPPNAAYFKKLGLRYCLNRESALYSVSVLDESKKPDLIALTPPEPLHSVRSPRFSPSGKHLVYFSSKNVVTHSGCAQLLKIHWDPNSLEKQKISVVLDYVPKAGSQTDYQGIYSQSLPRNCFINEHNVVFHTTKRTSTAVFSANIETNEVSLISRSYGANLVLDVVQNEGALILHSTPSSPHSVYFIPLKDFRQSPPNYFPVYSPDVESVSKLLENVEWKVAVVKPRDGSEDPVEIIITQPKNPKEATPLLVIPHGGPHSAFDSTYVLSSAFLTLLGYTLIHINFRGSVGFGQHSIKSLLGKIGENDLNDTEDSIVAILDKKLDIVVSGVGNVIIDGKSDWVVDKNSIALLGGSHSGYMIACMIGKVNSLFKYKASVIRNPVIDISTMVSITDIPDWCLVETGNFKDESSFNPYLTTVRTPELLLSLYKVSPISTISNVTTPTLLLLGGEDRRVPPSQGLSFYNGLRERGVKTKLLWYPKDNHSLSGAETEPDVWLNIALWLQEHLF